MILNLRTLFNDFYLPQITLISIDKICFNQCNLWQIKIKTWSSTFLPLAGGEIEDAFYKLNKLHPLTSLLSILPNTSKLPL
jgi:hypothetical protein